MLKKGLLAPFLLFEFGIFNDTNHAVWLKISSLIGCKLKKHQDRSFLVKNHQDIR
jgi:hypothetical protein